jgi:integrase
MAHRRLEQLAYRRFHSAAAQVGLGRRRPHDLRHAFASLLIREQRTSIVELAEQLGHAPTMTLNTYTHGKTRKGSKWLRATLTEAALAATRTKNSYLAAQYQRLRGRRGHSKAVTAVGPRS